MVSGVAARGREATGLVVVGRQEVSPRREIHQYDVDRRAAVRRGEM